MMRLIVALLLLGACREKPVRYEGLPPNAKPSCSPSILKPERSRCIVGGSQYLCLRDEYHDEVVIQCMPYLSWQFWK